MGSSKSAFVYFILSVVAILSLPAYSQSDLEKDSITYYPDGTIKSQGKIVDGKKQGLWTYFYENGSLLQENHYNGNNVSTKIFSREGILALEGTSKFQYKVNRKQLKEYGAAYASTPYLKPIKTWKFYTRNGKLVGVNKYFMGHLYYKNKIRIKKKETELFNPFADVKYERRVIDEDTFYIYPKKHDSTFIWFTNTKSELDPVNFLPSGKWAQFYAHDTIHIAHEFQIKGFNVHGRVDGYWPDGNIKSEWHFVNGTKNGKWTNWNIDGTVKDIYYYSKGGIEEFKTFHPNGKVSTQSKTLEKTDDYHLYEKTQWFEDGNKNSHGKVKHLLNVKVKTGLASLRIGPWEYYYTNGKIMQRGSYLEGKKHGDWITYDDDGSLITTKKYKKGELIQTINH